jgi:hypothetical protein
MCVAEKEFKIAGVTDCVARGFQRAGFQEYDTGEQASWMVQLTDQQDSEGGAAASGSAAPTDNDGAAASGPPESNSPPESTPQ